MRSDNFIVADWGGDERIVNENTLVVTEDYVGEDGRMSLKGMLDVMQQCAHKHLHAVNLSVERLMELGMMLFVTRISCKMHRMPTINEKLSTKTWTLPERRAGLLRYHTIDTADGECLIEAVSQWVCVDVNTRRLISSQGFVDAWSAPFPEMVNGYPAPKRLREKCELKSLNKIEIDESRLDFYGHVNNSEYAELVSESMEIKNPTAFRIAYTSEAKLGDVLDIKSFDDENSAYIEAEFSRGVSFKAKVYFNGEVDDAEIFC
ncbi:MAG: hypothetical protein IKU25_00665 [Clostridia bacterium]|nr:hypothetical protein [Clostridia bacterium]